MPVKPLTVINKNAARRARQRGARKLDRFLANLEKGFNTQKALDETKRTKEPTPASATLTSSTLDSPTLAKLNQSVTVVSDDDDDVFLMDQTDAVTNETLSTLTILHRSADHWMRTITSTLTRSWVPAHNGLQDVTADFSDSTRSVRGSGPGL